MVYLRGITIKTTMALYILTMFVALSSVEAAATKFAYKKPIYGKTTTTTTNTIKEKHPRAKPEVTKATTMGTTTAATTSTAATTTSTVATSATTVADLNRAANAFTTTMATVGAAEEAPKTTSNSSETETETEAEAGAEVEAEMQAASSLDEEKIEVPADEAEAVVNDIEEDALEADVGNIEMIAEQQQQHQHEEEDEQQEQVATPVLDVPMDMESTTVVTSNTATDNATATVTSDRKVAVPCTCGIFLSSQFKRGSSGPPLGKPVIVNELARQFPCTAVGQKQCQTKCLETIVQHLPNSASILCATLNRDCRKERAYLFIKNCRDHWTNTNLAAGREYCCKAGQPYTCPMV